MVETASPALMDMSLGELQKLVMDRRPGCMQFRSQRVGDITTELIALSSLGLQPSLNHLLLKLAGHVTFQGEKQLSFLTISINSILFFLMFHHTFLYTSMLCIHFGMVISYSLSSPWADYNFLEDRHSAYSIHSCILNSWELAWNRVFRNFCLMSKVSQFIIKHIAYLINIVNHLLSRLIKLQKSSISRFEENDNKQLRTKVRIKNKLIGSCHLFPFLSIYLHNHTMQKTKITFSVLCNLVSEW